MLDARVNAFRPDLADVALAGRVVAANYAQPLAYGCRATRVTMRAAPDIGAIAVNELLYGETFMTLEIGNQWAWGYSAHDGYVGYVAADALQLVEREPTHRISAPTALLFTRPDVKSPRLRTLPLNARVAVVATNGDFHHLAEGGFIHKHHLAPLGGRVPGDPVALANEFLGTPYLWGGRTRAGIDCSGLVQAVLMACGHDCPRDSDQQRDGLGRPIDPSRLQRGDLVFFPGHVGIMVDATQLLHANAYWMKAVIEPLGDVVNRLKPIHEHPILAAKRLQPL